jgi:hypothetical protein
VKRPQTRATAEQLEEATDALLLTMHDLRSVLVREKAERLMQGEGAPEAWRVRLCHKGERVRAGPVC